MKPTREEISEFKRKLLWLWHWFLIPSEKKQYPVPQIVTDDELFGWIVLGLLFGVPIILAMIEMAKYFR